MTKLVKENLYEKWVSTDTGVDRYNDNVYKNYDETEEKEIIKDAVPPPTVKLSLEEFEEYINGLIDIIPQSPGFALTVFNEVMKDHPYLSKRPIGFKSSNPYEPLIHKFIETFKTLKRK